ncbi:endonuclease domain-containing protein [Aeromonas enteropelogenes]|uniref:endonuclease domain-containing protein n=1 Tax=Aeromonas enteropelogenes TaxID=29489 RepID=UPI001CCA661D|nr:DUF559 domain-containing protein [Aeromonas enteropelogenes]UBH27007.1 endonuclease domain-containing protein [Aeromonas enteropelogenes]
MNEMPARIFNHPATLEKRHELRGNPTEPERLLVIEVDGDSHFDERGLSHDEQRDAYMARLSLTVLRFSNREVMQNLSGVVVSIRTWLDHV